MQMKNNFCAFFLVTAFLRSPSVFAEDTGVALDGDRQVLTRIKNDHFEVELEVCLKNNGKEQRIKRPDLFSDIKIEIFDERRNEVVKLTSYGTHLCNTAERIAQARFLILKEKESLRIKICLAQIYDLSRPGKYIVKTKYSSLQLDGTWKSVDLLDCVFEVKDRNPVDAVIIPDLTSHGGMHVP
jgi:hypothetical protein